MTIKFDLIKPPPYAITETLPQPPVGDRWKVKLAGGKTLTLHEFFNQISEADLREVLPLFLGCESYNWEVPDLSNLTAGQLYEQASLLCHRPLTLPWDCCLLQGGRDVIRGRHLQDQYLHMQSWQKEQKLAEMHAEIFEACQDEERLEKAKERIKKK
jgi:hypothetical protein